MSSPDYLATPELIRSLDAAIAGKNVNELTSALRHTLCKLIREGLRLPDAIYVPNSVHYARREIYLSPDLGYSVIAMTWGPKQGTSLHDHAGTWCVEGVLAGSLEITQYELTDRDQERFRFEQRGSLEAGAGSAGSLIPPHEYHTICNPSSETVAVTLHVYGGQLTCCAHFRPTGEHWYQRESKQLSLDA